MSKHWRWGAVLLGVVLVVGLPVQTQIVKYIDGVFVAPRRGAPIDRELPLAVNKLNVYALGIRLADLERRDKIESLLKAVKASFDNPGYAFVVVETDGSYLRYFPMRLTPLDHITQSVRPLQSRR